MHFAGFPGWGAIGDDDRSPSSGVDSGVEVWPHAWHNGLLWFVRSFNQGPPCWLCVESKIPGHVYVYKQLFSNSKHGCTLAQMVKALDLKVSTPGLQFEPHRDLVLFFFFSKLALFFLFFSIFLIYLIFTSYFNYFHNFYSAFKKYQKHFFFLHYFHKNVYLI